MTTCAAAALGPAAQQARVHLPLLVFEVLEGQVHNLLDEAIQKRMQRDLGRETELIFSSGISLCRAENNLGLFFSPGFTVIGSNETRRVQMCLGRKVPVGHLDPKTHLL